MASLPPRGDVVMTYPPMLPLISHDAKFVFCTDLELQQFATNAALVAQLQDSLACWLSHIADIIKERQEYMDGLDKAETIRLDEVEPQLVTLELVFSFHLHFDRKEVLACTRLLSLIPAAAKHLQALQDRLVEVKTYHEEIVEALSHVRQAAEYLRGGPWVIFNVADTMPPLFSALRALWVCSSVFGPAHIHRFSAVVADVVQRVEHACHDCSFDAIDRLIASPSVAVTLKQQLVAAQDAAVAVQECFFDLRESMSASGVIGTQRMHTVLSDVDDMALFSQLEWYYERIKGILMCIDALKKEPNKIGSILTDPLSHIDLMNPDVLDQNTFLKCMNAIVSEKAPSADAILERMTQKQAAAAGNNSGGSSSLAKRLTNAPRIPFDSLGNGLMILLEFNPPVMTVMGGPVSVNFLDAAQYTLPGCCSNANIRNIARKGMDPIFVCLAKDVQQLHIHDQFCDEAHVAHMIQTILDLVESEDAWKMTDSLAQYLGGKEVHWLHFRKHRSKKKRASVASSRSPTGSPATRSPVLPRPQEDTSRSVSPIGGEL